MIFKCWQLIPKDLKYSLGQNPTSQTKNTLLSRPDPFTIDLQFPVYNPAL